MYDSRSYGIYERCRRFKFFVDEVSKGFNPAVAALQNVGKLALPAADKVKAILADKKGGNKFYLRSILISCGVLPYNDLYKLEAG